MDSFDFTMEKIYLALQKGDFSVVVDILTDLVTLFDKRTLSLDALDLDHVQDLGRYLGFHSQNTIVQEGQVQQELCFQNGQISEGE